MQKTRFLFLLVLFGTLFSRAETVTNNLDVQGGFIYNHGFINPGSVTNGYTFTNAGIRDLTISAGQLGGVNPEDGSAITNQDNLVVIKAQSITSVSNITASGTFIGDGSGLTNLDAGALVGSISAQFMPTSGTWDVAGLTVTNLNVVGGALDVDCLIVRSNLVVGIGQATGLYAVAAGYETSAGGDFSQAEGYFTTAGAFGSHAEGGWSMASGGGSHAEGLFTVASGHYSHAEGYNTIAAGAGSHAAGYGARATHDHTYVWSDGQIIGSTTTKQYTVYAENGIRLLGGPIEGDGSGLTNLNATNLFGVISTNRLPAEALQSGGGLTNVAWGSISGSLTNQSDLVSALAEKADADSLANVATSGNYADLTNAPVLAAVATDAAFSNLTVGAGEIEQSLVSGLTNDLAGKLVATWTNSVGTMAYAETNDYVTTIDAANYVDKFSATNSLNGILNMSSNRVIQIADPVDEGDAVNLKSLYELLTALPAQGDLEMGSYTNGVQPTVQF